MLHIDEKKRVVMNLGLVWTIVAAVAVSAFWIGVSVNQLKNTDHDHDERLANLELQTSAQAKVNAEIYTRLAIIETRTANIEENTREIKALVNRLQ